ncbi:hypothetical protein OG2516_07263 [Oceanicola granulosus HTCC2516]|uniref:HPt domain-containing protein n=1 Tax=Oceanicola granulosus (strain ATCC BAA-861 / DSM 15982 / KCTC 12143 / HTCC2516) TaxID=314256 RepID=Q2CCA7_OCEGH|nr:Hpt domain-containing protein [Oceanicola granulosus]EAR50326.1 hypothetical protein OG2516_07263 [Oceanicola granulosus HTCC2516]
MSGLQLSSSALIRLRAGFLRVHVERHDRMEEILAAARAGEASSDDLSEAQTILHRIAGAAGSLGLAPLGDAARETELVFIAVLEDGQGEVQECITALDWFLGLSLDYCDAA